MQTILLSLGKGNRRKAGCDPWVEGYEARQERQARSANPYRGEDARELWDLGWVEAEQEARVAGAKSVGGKSC